MKWNDITIEQYQALYPILTDTKLTGIDRETKVISLFTGLTESQIDHKSVEWFKDKRAEYKFLHSGKIEGSHRRFIKGHKRTYKVRQKVEQMPAGRYAEIKSWVAGEQVVIERMHMIIASMCVPMKRKWGILVEDTYDATKHEEYAQDLLGAKFADAYHTMVFFWNLYSVSIRAIRGYMIQLMTEEGMKPKEAIQAVDGLADSMDGFTTANKLPSLKGYQLRRLGRFLPLDSLTTLFTSKPKPSTTGS